MKFISKRNQIIMAVVALLCSVLSIWFSAQHYERKISPVKHAQAKGGDDVKIYNYDNVPHPILDGPPMDNDVIDCTVEQCPPSDNLEPNEPSDEESGVHYVTYTVKAGDTLWDIAKKFDGGNIKDLWQKNKDRLIAHDKRNAVDHGHWIYPGEHIVISSYIVP